MKIHKWLMMGSMMVGAWNAQVALADASLSGKIDIREVQDAILTNNAGWKAKENWVSRLSKSERRAMMGLGYRVGESLDSESDSLFHVSAERAIDWRDRNGVNYVGPMLNQGSCGSCVAFAAVGTFETQVSISSGAPWLRPSFSPQALFGCGGGGCDRGWTPASAAKRLQSKGVPDEACLPYTSGVTSEDVACSKACADAGARSSKLDGFETPTKKGLFSCKSVDCVKTALAKGPLMTTMDVYADFDTYSSGVYKHVSGEYEGGHAISIVGYDDDQRAWLIRNSWGEGWGEKGYAWISWDDTSGVGRETWLFNVAPKASLLTIETPSDRQYFSDAASLTVKAKGVDLSSTKFVIQGAGRTVSTPVCSSRSDLCTAGFDSRALPDGRYEAYAEAGGVRSQAREFFVLNQEPVMSLAVSPDKGVNFSKLKGTIYFLVNASSGAVPMQNLTIRLFDASGKMVRERKNGVVVDRMKFGLDSTRYPNGTYRLVTTGEISYRGKVYSVDSPAAAVTIAN